MRAKSALVMAFSAALVSALVSQPVHATSKVSTASLLAKLKVAREYQSGYQREYFKLWVDTDHDGCNTRKEVLLAEAKQKPSESSSCALYGGLWKSAYDNQNFTNSRSLDIDHMVPLSEAWQSGAYRWDADTRERYANDLGYSRSLIAVSATSNRSKSDQDPYLWMPPNRSYWCQYVDDWIAIKYRWSLTIDTAEKRDLAAKVKACGARAYAVKPPLAVRHFGNIPTGGGNSGGSSGGNGGGTGGGNGTDPRFSSCRLAKASGYGPYYRGKDPEYYWYRDGDGDGIACE